MSDKYVIQIAKEGGVQTCEKDENGKDKKTSDGRCIVASIDTESQINFVCDNDNINLEGIDKKIKNKLQNNESFTKKREEYNQAKYRIILKDVKTHDKGDLYLFSTKKDSLNYTMLYEDLENTKDVDNIIKKYNGIHWNEFCHIEEFYEDDKKNKILNGMNRLFITDKNFNKDNDILCFINKKKYIVDLFDYEKVHIVDDL